MTTVGNPFNTPSGRVQLEASNQTINALNQLAAGGAPPTSTETTSGLSSSNAGTIATAPITTSGTVLGSSVTQSTQQSPNPNMQQLLQTLTQVVAQLQQIMTQLATVMNPNTNGGGAIQTPAPGGGKPGVGKPGSTEPAPPPGGGPTDSQQIMQALTAVTQQVQQLVQLVNTMMPGGINQSPVPGGGGKPPGGDKPVLPGEPNPGGNKPVPGGGKPITNNTGPLHLTPVTFGGKPAPGIKQGLKECEDIASKLLNGKYENALDPAKLRNLMKEFRDLTPKLKNENQKNAFFKAENMLVMACDKNIPVTEREMYLAGFHSFLARQIDVLK